MVDPATEKLNYDQIMALAKQCKPKVIVAGFTSYPWTPDWQAFRAIADEVGAYLLADVSHIAGLIAAGELPSPVGIADVVSFTTHKTLCGPRGAVLIAHDRELGEKIDKGVFPGEQGGPHVNVMAAMALAFKLAKTESFKEMSRQTIRNAGLSRTRSNKMASGCPMTARIRTCASSTANPSRDAGAYLFLMAIWPPGYWTSLASWRTATRSQVTAPRLPLALSNPANRAAARNGFCQNCRVHCRIILRHHALYGVRPERKESARQGGLQDPDHHQQQSEGTGGLKPTMDDIKVRHSYPHYFYLEDSKENSHRAFDLSGENVRPFEILKE